MTIHPGLVERAELSVPRALCSIGNINSFGGGEAVEVLRIFCAFGRQRCDWGIAWEVVRVVFFFLFGKGGTVGFIRRALLKITAKYLWEGGREQGLVEL